MSVAAARIAAHRALSVLKDATCEIRTAASHWAPNPSSSVKCHYETASPVAGAHLDYEGGNGYGYTVWFDEPVSGLVENDTVVIVASPNPAAVGTKIQVKQIPPLGNNGIVDRIDGTRRDA